MLDRQDAVWGSDSAKEYEMAFIVALRDVQEVRRASSLIGLTVPDVAEIYAEGLLPELERYLVPLGVIPSATNRPGFLSKAARVPTSQNCRHEINVASCRFALDGNLAAAWSTILRAIQEGSLEVVRGPNTRRGLLADLFVTDFDQLASVLKSAQKPGHFRDVPLTHSEVAMTIGRAHPQGAAIAKSRLLNGSPSVQQIVDLRKAWVLSSELFTLAHIFGRPMHDFYRRLNRSGVGGLTEGSLKLWSRAEALDFLGLPHLP
jgi:hypothetical protein